MSCMLSSDVSLFCFVLLVVVIMHFRFQSSKFLCLSCSETSIKVISSCRLLLCICCSFNQLDLPEYTSKEQLQERLLLAIHEANEGFGFGWDTGAGWKGCALCTDRCIKQGLQSQLTLLRIRSMVFSVAHHLQQMVGRDRLLDYWNMILRRKDHIYSQSASRKS